MSRRVITPCQLALSLVLSLGPVTGALSAQEDGLTWRTTAHYRFRDGVILHQDGALHGLPVAGLRRVEWHRGWQYPPGEIVVRVYGDSRVNVLLADLAALERPVSSEVTAAAALSVTDAEQITGAARVVWVRDAAGNLRSCRVHSVLRTAPPGEWQVAVSLLDGAVVEVRDLVRHVDIEGSVQALLPPAGLPYTGPSGLLAQPLPDLIFQPVGFAGPITSGPAGEFLIPGATGPVLYVAHLAGPQVTVLNDAGPEAELIGNLATSGSQVILFNDPPDEFTAAQAGAFHALSSGRRWLDQVSPGFAPATIPIEVTVNLAGSCFAFFTPAFGIYCTRAGGGCPNAAYSTVVAHEYFHHIAYAIGGWSVPYEEAMADVFAAYLAATAVIGTDFYGPMTELRSLAGSAQFPVVSSDPALVGLPLAQAFWDLREFLLAALGPSGADVAAELWLGSALLGGGVVGPQILDDLLMLDDDDGDLATGTPHAPEIIAALAGHGLGPLVLPVTNLTCTLFAGQTVHLDWQLPPHQLTALQVRRNGQLIASLPGSETSLQLVGQPAGDHIYSVTAVAGASAALPAGCSLTIPIGSLFVRGDADGNGVLNLVDPIAIIFSILVTGHALGCPDAGDVNDNGQVEISDPSYLLAYLFTQGTPPPAPFPAPGLDPTPDTLLCP